MKTKLEGGKISAVLERAELKAVRETIVVLDVISKLEDDKIAAEAAGYLRNVLGRTDSAPAQIASEPNET